MRRRAIMLGMPLLVVLALGATACSEPAPAPSFALSSLPVTPTPTVTPATAAQIREIAKITSGPCAGGATAMALPTGDTDPEQLGGMTILVPHDRGPRPHAMGEVRVDDAGIPIAYIVAEDDVLDTVAARLCAGDPFLHWVNAVRRDGDALYAGDTLNLDAHTIFTVGDQNGVVHDNALPEGFVIPPQR
jgi:hypothetical protein